MMSEGVADDALPQSPLRVAVTPEWLREQEEKQERYRQARPRGGMKSKKQG